METRAHYVAVGTFVLAMVFLAFVAVLWLAGTQFSTTFNRYVIYFEGPVSGLSDGAKVEYNGIPVGTVTDIEIVSSKDELALSGGKQIRVMVQIKSNVEIKKDAAASLQTNILSGVSFILISPGKSPEPLEARKGERYPAIRSHRSTLSSLAARGPQLLDKLDGILDNVNDLLSDQNRKTFAAALDHIEKATGALAQHGDEIASDAGEALKSAATLFTNLDKSYSTPGGLKDQLSGGLQSATTLFTDLDKSYSTPGGLKDQLSGGIDNFDKLAKGLGLTVQDVRPGLRTFSQRTLGDVDALVSEVRQFVSGLSRLASQLERDPTRLLFGDRREGYHPK